MQPSERDAAYLWDMIDAGKDILDFIQDIEYFQFERNKMLRYAVER